MQLASKDCMPLFASGYVNSKRLSATGKASPFPPEKLLSFYPKMMRPVVQIGNFLICQTLIVELTIQSHFRHAVLCQPVSTGTHEFRRSSVFGSARHCRDNLGGVPIGMCHDVIRRRRPHHALENTDFAGRSVAIWTDSGTSMRLR